MPLKTLVKVGSISNLSDARYCSGMGVDMLGFRVMEGQENFVTPKSYQEIRGWISGPSVVAEIYGVKSQNDLVNSIEHYAPDFLELDSEELSLISSEQTIPLIVSLDHDSYLKHKNEILSRKNQIAHILLKDQQSTDFINTLAKDFSILLAIESGSDVPSVLENLPLKGIVLNGSKELKPGLKDYDHLSRVLEKLEVD